MDLLQGRKVFSPRKPMASWDDGRRERGRKVEIRGWLFDSSSMPPRFLLDASLEMEEKSGRNQGRIGAT